MVPLQAPRVVWAARTPAVTARWHEHITAAAKVISSHPEPLNYDRPWFVITWDTEEILASLGELIDNPGTVVAFDTETTGLWQFVDGQSVVFVMLRWTDKDGKNRCIGFPWDWPDSPLSKESRAAVAPRLVEALMASRVVGHNLVFDMLWVYATMTDRSEIGRAHV